MNNYTPAAKSQHAVAKNPVDNLVSMIKSFEPQIKAALPRHLTPERMTRILMTEVRKNPKLADCDRASFFGSILTCVQLGLEPGPMGHVYLLPYKNKGKMEVQLIIGYQGMIDLTERDGRVTVEAHVVHEKDHFEFEYGLEPKLVHRPYFGADDPGEVIAAYSIARYKDGRYKYRLITKAEIDDARKASMSGKSDYSPWSRFYAEMARKTAVRRLFKYLPKSPEMAKVQELEDKIEIGEGQNLDDEVTTLPALPIEDDEVKMDSEKAVAK